MAIDIIIIGAGASGLTAAVFAARAGAKVMLLEKQPRAGKKLLAAGNGRCNLTNHAADTASFYHSESMAEVCAVLAAFPLRETLRFFEDLGVPVREEDGRLYPYSLQAGAVLDALRFEAESLGVTLVTETAVTAVSGAKNRFELGGFTSRRVITACGGLASPHLGSDGSGHGILEALGHTRTRVFPGLVQLCADKAAIKGLSGVKTVVSACLHGAARRTGVRDELLFTDYGLSGPLALAVSRAVGESPGRGLTLEVDFLPELTDLAAALRERRTRHTRFPAQELFLGLLHKRVTLALLRTASVPPDTPLCALSDSVLNRLAALAHSYPIPVTGTRGFRDAQITCGGIRLDEFDPKTLESKLCPGLYACGEVLDADGDCGGFNLQWAWSSGALAGRSAGCFG